MNKQNSVRIPNRIYDNLMRKKEQLERNLQTSMHAEARQVIRKKLTRITALLEHCEVVL